MILSFKYAIFGKCNPMDSDLNNVARNAATCIASATVESRAVHLHVESLKDKAKNFQSRLSIARVSIPYFLMQMVR